MNYYPKYPGDYLRDTGELTLAEHGAYNLLLDYYYSAKGRPFPKDRRRIYRLLRADTAAERDAVNTVLEAFWYETEDGWENQKANEVMQQVAVITEKRRQAALKRWAKREEASTPDANAMQMHKPGMSNQNQNQSQNQTKPIKEERECEARAREIDPMAKSFSQPLQDFEKELRDIYPWRAPNGPGQQNWPGAMDQVQARMQEGFTREAIAAAVGRYRVYCTAKGTVGTDYVATAREFMRDPENLRIPWEVPPEPLTRKQRKEAQGNDIVRRRLQQTAEETRYGEDGVRSVDHERDALREGSTGQRHRS